MNVFIPIGGIGKRFKDEGYQLPKPLIKVLGTPMISKVIGSLLLDPDDIIHIVYHPELNAFNFKESTQKEFPNRKFRFVELEKTTRGAAETIICGLQGLSDEEISGNFLVLDCDTFYRDDVIGKYKQCENKNSIFYFLDTEDKPIFSYIKFDEDSKIYEIKEKEKISDFANTGAYGFQSGGQLLDYCQQVMSLDGELYVSRVYDLMLKAGETISAVKVDSFDCVGTPLQLRVFCEREKPQQKPRVCFDLDNTLVSFPQVPNDYTTVLPLQNNIDYLRFLKSKGAYIIIYTARRMKTHKGNVGAIVADIGKITIDTLERFEIPYDELHFGKPHADFYVDDLAVNAFSSLDKEIGFYKTQTEPRSFNQVEFTEDFVLKKTPNLGEIYWYDNIPPILSRFCPKIFKTDTPFEGYIMERIKGVNFSYLYINNALKVSDLSALMGIMNSIHSHSLKTPDVDIYANYVPKLKERYEKNRELYESFPQAAEIYQELIRRLQIYQDENRGSGSVIHGDPVFSNVIMTENDLKLIDPRGKLGNELSVYGDYIYDNAKIYQSIMGYDHILNDREISHEYRDRMVNQFEGYFPPYVIPNIKLVTASLFFSLIPLHTHSPKRFTKYLNLTQNLLK